MTVSLQITANGNMQWKILIIPRPTNPTKNLFFFSYNWFVICFVIIDCQILMHYIQSLFHSPLYWSNDISIIKKNIKTRCMTNLIRCLFIWSYVNWYEFQKQFNVLPMWMSVKKNQRTMWSTFVFFKSYKNCNFRQFCLFLFSTSCYIWLLHALIYT